MLPDPDRIRFCYLLKSPVVLASIIASDSRLANYLITSGVGPFIFIEASSFYNILIGPVESVPSHRTASSRQIDSMSIHNFI
jgi:hypothetical protein